MNFRDDLDNIMQYENRYGFRCVPIPFLEANFAHCADQLTIEHSVLGLLAVTYNGLWYPFWPEKADEKLPEISSEPPSSYHMVEGHSKWKDACIAALNPEARLNDRTDSQCTLRRGGITWREKIKSRLSRLRDPFVVDVIETALCGLKKMEAGEEI